MLRPKRAWVDRGLERIHFELDRRPALDYQPLPWLGVAHADREAGVVSRWEALEPWLGRLAIRSAIDLGCNVGYYPISLGLAGVAAIGVEPDPKLFRIFRYAIRRLGLDHVGALDLKITPNTVAMLPRGNLIIFFAVWHHLVRAYGLEEASRMLRVTWERADKAMAFETGEGEMPPSYGLPDFTPDASTWLTDFLHEQCAGGSVVHLGRHDAFDPKRRPCRRNLFLVVRE
jgi:hypothetical protein